MSYMNETEEKKPIKSKRNTCLGFFEALACVMIVFIHCKFPGTLGVIMEGLARFGTPLFFVVSGFFLINSETTAKDLRAKLKKRSLRVFALLMFSFAIYFVLGALTSCLGDVRMSFVEYLASVFDWKKLVLLIVCNNPLTNVINWFMVAMLFSYLIIFLLPNLFIKNRYFPIVLSSLLLVVVAFRLVITATGFSIFGISLDNAVLYRSWYANGLLFISLGIVLKRHEKFLLKIPFKYTVLIFLVSFAFSALENIVISKYIGPGISYYLVNIVCIISIIAMSVQKPDLFSKAKFINQKGNWTMFVYVLHPAFITILGYAIAAVGLESNAVIPWVKPLIVVVVSVAAAMVLNLLLNSFKRVVHKKPEV